MTTTLESARQDGFRRGKIVVRAYDYLKPYYFKDPARMLRDVHGSNDLVYTTYHDLKPTHANFSWRFWVCVRIIIGGEIDGDERRIDRI